MTADAWRVQSNTGPGKENGMTKFEPGTSGEMGEETANRFVLSKEGLTVLDSLAEGVLVIDKANVILYSNRQIEGLTGYPAAELIGKPLDMLLPERFMSVHREHVAGYFTSPRLRPMGRGLDLIARRKDGLEFPVEISLSFLETNQGPVGLAFVTDISVRKELEQELLERNEELDAFAHTVAHDLNSSVALIAGYAEMLVDMHKDLPPEQLHDLLERLAYSSRKMSSIVNELLLFATLHRDEIPLQTLDMQAIVGEVLRRLESLIEESGTVMITPDHWADALGYAPWIEEVWVNYISNGIKYGGKPPILELGSGVERDGWVRYWVKDNGAGLTPAQQAQLFLPLSTRHLPKIKGFGLGLSIVKRILEKLGGRVTVESEFGEGSEFSFWLRGNE